MIRGKMLVSCGRVIVRAVISAGVIDQSLPLPSECRPSVSKCAHLSSSSTSTHQPESTPARNVHASCCGFPKDMVNGPSMVRDHGIVGDDACFIARFKNTHVVGVADGVGGWRRYGIDPSEFSSRLMKICSELVQIGEFEPCRPDRLLAHAYETLSAPPRPIGSSTACILIVDHDILYSANLGDSGFLVLRRGEVVYRSREQTHYFNAPFQLSLLPDSARAAGFLGDPPEKAELNSIDLQSGDIVVLATDGLWDNVSENLIIEQLSNIQPGDIQAACNTLALTARRLAFDSRHLSPFAVKASQHGINAPGGKPDDITLVALTNNMSSSARSEKHRIRSCTDSELLTTNTPDKLTDNEQMAPPYRARLYQLFGHIEKEFDALYAENCALRVKLNQLSERFGESVSIPSDLLTTTNEASIGRKESGRKVAAIQMGQKLRTALRVPPGSRLVQSLKVGVSDSSRRFKYVRNFSGHRDGVWHVATSRGLQPVLASASADQTCLLWSLDSGCCLAQYSGHSGSVNAVAFNPSSIDPGDLTIATASGDHTAHLWKACVAGGVQQQTISSEDEEIPDRETNNATEETTTENEMSAVASIRQPLRRLTGHTGVVIAVDWITGGEQLITASWDRTANIYDAERGEILNVLSGHDDELNHCSAHLSQKLVVTASRDSTFRLWDFREPIHSVAVFQGHNDSVTSVVFSATDKLVSGSDDRSIKVWDLRNMRSAIATVRLDSATNRLAISRKNLVAIPHDNRNVRVYDLNSVRLTRLPRANGRSHRRMVCCAAWADDHASNDLITCGFDKQIIAWKTSVGKE